MMLLIDGRKLRDEILEKLKIEVSALSFRPIFSDVLVGNNSASVQYVNMKNKVAESIGIEALPAAYPESITTEDLVAIIHDLNKVERMSGLIVQLPLPAHIDTARVLDAIDPAIDVDAIGAANSRRFYEGDPLFVFPTAAAVMALIDSLPIDIAGLSVAVVGRGELVGRPVAHLLALRGVRPVLVNRSTQDFAGTLRAADVIISGVGRGGLITRETIKQDAILIDAGTSEANGSVVGDVDFESVKEKAGYISPVPGGVGPVTVAMLFSNVVKAAKTKPHPGPHLSGEGEMQ